ncbi:MAG TPA: dihydrolipoamide acetyltransferase family protein [Roseiflexaceae bacterium]|nr:dihydrolipoamide acetyltransferase family protein [Roseiflexaceae bacterium]
MPTEINMPQLGESVVEGTISKWLKRPGERVEKYEALLEVMTDKVDTEVPAPEAGVLREILVPEGQTVRVGTLIALLDGAETGAQPAAAAPAAHAAHSNGEVSHTAVVTATAAVAAPPAGQSGYRGPVSPVVARLAAEHNLDLGLIAGTGQGGRVSKQDVLRYLEQRKDEPALAAAPASAPAAMPVPAAPAAQRPALSESLARPQPSTLPEELPEDAEIVPVSPMRRAIAEHMVRSRRTAPHVTSFFEVDVSRIIAHRARHKDDFERQGVKLTFTPYFVQAAVAGLQAVPLVNASYTDEGIVAHQRMHIGIAVALEDGLIVPVLRDADEKNLLGLARGVNDLSDRARARRLKSAETQGGTFTITNHGVSGSLFATPIINQPQAAIMGVGAIQKRPVVITQDGVDAIAIRPLCFVSLTIDHRLLDGAAADKFLSVLKRTIETYG